MYRIKRFMESSLIKIKIARESESALILTTLRHTNFLKYIFAALVVGKNSWQLHKVVISKPN